MRPVLRTEDISLYEHTPGPPRTLICSTVPSRELLTDPAVTGHRYRRLVRSAVVQALRALVSAGEIQPFEARTDQVAVLNVLRGGLSFGVEDALAEVLGADPSVSFVGTGRTAGTPVELTYERWELRSATVLFLGDIIGTGMTLTRVLHHLREHFAARCPELRSVWIFTIGSRPGIRELSASVAASGERNGPKITIVAFESLFELPDPATNTAIERFPFDLVRSPVHSSPEYEAARLRSLGSLFERCAIYDGGVRAFTPDEHHQLRLAWWENLAEREVSIAELAELTAGLSLYEMPLQDWIARIPWAGHPGIEAEALHRLGREVLLMARELPLEQYLATFIVPDTRTS